MSAAPEFHRIDIERRPITPRIMKHTDDGLDWAGGVSLLDDDQD